MESASRSTEVAAALAEIEKKGMKGVDISDNELAKTHARYRIGGRAKVPNERLFRFGPYDVKFPPCIVLLIGLLSCFRRISGEAWCPTKILAWPAGGLEHLVVPLQESWCW